MRFESEMIRRGWREGRVRGRVRINRHLHCNIRASRVITIIATGVANSRGLIARVAQKPPVSARDQISLSLSLFLPPTCDQNCRRERKVRS